MTRIVLKDPGLPDLRLFICVERLACIDIDLQNPKHYLHALLSNDSPKKTFYQTWAKILEDKYILEDTPEKIPFISNQLRRKLISMKQDSKIVWMYGCLAPKYKQRDFNPADLYGEQTKTSSPNINYEVENKQYIDRITDHIAACTKIREKLKSVEFLSKKDKKGVLLLEPGRVQSDLKIMDAADNLMVDMWDNRTEVSVNTQHMLVSMVLRFNSGYAAGAYLGFIKDFGAAAMGKSVSALGSLLSPKQVGKIMRGLCKNLHVRYDPKSKDEAMETGFYGDRCENCFSWRVVYESIYNTNKGALETRSRCYGCNETWVPELELLPGMRDGIVMDSDGTI